MNFDFLFFGQWHRIEYTYARLTPSDTQMTEWCANDFALDLLLGPFAMKLLVSRTLERQSATLLV